MKRQLFSRWFFVLALLAALIGMAAASVSASDPDLDGFVLNPAQSAELSTANTVQRSTAASQTIIIDHISTDITAIPQTWIEAAKQSLHIAYGHTSHGSQLTNGMTGLVDFANGGGKGLSLPQDIFAWSNGGTGGALDLHDYAMGGDVGYYPQWVDNTISYLGAPDPTTGRGTSHSDVNVIIWSWCGQASGYTEQMMLDQYLLPMTQLELDYPGVTFVYMTGHSDGSGEDGNLHTRNQQIRDYCVQNNKVLYDFYDIELYDPDGNYYGDKAVNDNCDYDSDGNDSRDSNWAGDWQNSHTQDTDWYDCSCAHSQSLNCNQKAYAVWWLWARLAGWDGGSAPVQIEAQKTVSTETAVPGQVVTYTVAVQNLGAPFTDTVHLTDETPSGLQLIEDSCTFAGNGQLPPTLQCQDNLVAWQGTLSDTAAITVTYAVTVSALTPQVITNTAVISVSGYQPLTRSAWLTVTQSADTPNLALSYKAASTQYASHGERVTYTISIHNSPGPLSQTVLLTDVVPIGMLYVPGSLTATTGVVVDADAPTLRWTGVLTPSPVATVTYATVVTYTPGSTIILPAVITNTATIAASGYPPITRTATVQTNWVRLYLPLVLKH